MTDLRKILGTSFMSLLLVIWGLFMVCSGRVPQVGYEDDLSDDEFYTENDNQGGDAEVVNQLAVLDEESTNLEDFQRKEILEALGIDASQQQDNPDNQYLSEEMFLDLEVQIAELEKQAKQKDHILDSLRLEMQDTDVQLAALDEVVESPSTGYASKDRTAPIYTPPAGSESEYTLAYQDAMNDVYSRNYPQAITKFQDLLKLPDTDHLADNAQYWIGECYYAMGNYEMAIAEFEKVFAFDTNNKIDDAQFMIGMAYVRIGEKSLAQTELLNLLSFFQNSEYIGRAEDKMGELQI